MPQLFGEPTTRLRDVIGLIALHHFSVEIYFVEGNPRRHLDVS
jgi:hypothetical protein